MTMHGLANFKFTQNTYSPLVYHLRKLTSQKFYTLLKHKFCIVLYILVLKFFDSKLEDKRFCTK